VRRVAAEPVPAVPVLAREVRALVPVVRVVRVGRVARAESAVQAVQALAREVRELVRLGRLLDRAVLVLEARAPGHAADLEVVLLGQAPVTIGLSATKRSRISAICR